MGCYDLISFPIPDMGCDLPICWRGHRRYYDMECKYVSRLEILDPNLHLLRCSLPGKKYTPDSYGKGSHVWYSLSSAAASSQVWFHCFLHWDQFPSIWLVAVNLVTLVGASVASISVTLPSAIILSKIYANSMMVLVNSRTIPASENGTRGEVATLQIGTLQFGGPSAGTSTTEDQHEEHLKDSSFVRGETREVEAWNNSLHIIYIYLLIFL